MKDPASTFGHAKPSTEEDTHLQRVFKKVQRQFFPKGTWKQIRIMTALGFVILSVMFFVGSADTILDSMEVFGFMVLSSVLGAVIMFGAFWLAFSIAYRIKKKEAVYVLQNLVDGQGEVFKLFETVTPDLGYVVFTNTGVFTEEELLFQPYQDFSIRCQSIAYDKNAHALVLQYIIFKETREKRFNLPADMTADQMPQAVSAINKHITPG